MLNLFKVAYSLHSRVDHAISNAGILELGTILDTGLDDAAIEEAPSIAVLNVNLIGSYYFTRVAVHYLRKSKETSKGEQRDASLVLVSSTSGFHNYKCVSRSWRHIEFLANAALYVAACAAILLVKAVSLES